MICLMSVNPGFGGQKFIPQSLEKIKHLREFIKRKESSTLIEVDGGVNENNVKAILDTGTGTIVAGSSIFNSANPQKTVKKFKNL